VIIIKFLSWLCKLLKVGKLCIFHCVTCPIANIEYQYCSLISILWLNYCHYQYFLQYLLCLEYIDVWCSLVHLLNCHLIYIVNSLSSVSAPYRLWGGNAPWFMCWFWRHINCLCLLNFFPPFLPSFFLFLCFISHLFSSLFTSWFTYLLTYLSTPSRIDSFHF